MSYLSLYRKWRSQDFEEIVGQPVIVQTLQNAIKFNRLAHAYLFTGPRGTGKTSVARILAKALNCQQGPIAKPCGQCANCQKIKAGQAVDVVEIDAASNRGIDEIRELRERVRYAPLEGRYKVYIIDEVHMLTTEAFNALLKTLEEPPAHTIFILATTDVQKVPLTIASRCQRLDFTRLKLEDIKGQLKKIAAAEKLEIEDKALELVARSAEGGMRDAISLLDQLASFTGGQIGYDHVVTLLGTADETYLFDFAAALLSGSIDQVLLLVKRGVEGGQSLPQTVRDLTGHFRNLLHLKVGSGEALELTADQLARLKEQATKFSLEKIKEVISTLVRAEQDMRWHPYARLVLEIGLLELLNKPSFQAAQPLAPTASPPAPEVREKPITTTKPADKVLPAEPPTEKRLKPEATGFSPFEKIEANWKKILDNMRQKSIYGFVSLHEGEPLEISEQGRLVIAFSKGYSFHKERLEESKNRQALEAAIREVTGLKLSVECVIREKKHRSAAISAGAVADFFEGRLI